MRKVSIEKVIGKRLGVISDFNRMEEEPLIDDTFRVGQVVQKSRRQTSLPLKLRLKSIISP
jgi:hypothetical protein